VRDGFAGVKASLAKHAPSATFEGVVVARMVSGGVELVLGVQRDPEVGPVLMFGAGGVLLELIKDVSFGPAELTRGGARAMIARTKIAKQLAGYRGAPPADAAAVETALVALSELVRDLADEIESVDINPYVALAQGQGAVALDGLIVLRAAR
jgi:acyl-CoA synthetase (NDP forming)